MQLKFDWLELSRLFRAIELGLESIIIKDFLFYFFFVNELAKRNCLERLDD